MNYFVLKKALGIALVTGIFLFLISYTTVSLWQMNGFNLLEVGLMSIISGVILFVLLLLANLLGFNAIKKANNHQSPNKLYTLIIILFSSLLVYVVLDSLVFLLIDSSISEDYAVAVRNLMSQNDEYFEGINDFSRLPFSLQNLIITFGFGVISMLISLPFIKK